MNLNLKSEYKMIYKFKSKSNGDLIMLEENGRQILEIIGKCGSAKGIVLVEQMSAAIESLETAIAKEHADKQQAPSDDSNTNEEMELLSLRHRALPFIVLLKRCLHDGTELVWGV